MHCKTYFLAEISVFTMWQTWLVAAVAIFVLLAITFIWMKKKLKQQVHENGLLQQRVIEHKEMLKYSRESEQKAKDESESASNSKSILLAKLSHEIRTPMNGVIGMASLLSETLLTTEQKEYTEIIIQSSENLMTTINDMLVTDVLHYSENDGARMELEDKDFELRSTIENVLDAFAGKAVQKETELIYYMDKDVPELIVGDEVRLKQILMNLVENAFRFTAGGEIYIAVRCDKMLDGNQVNLAFEVRDTGKAMPLEEKDMLSKDISDINTRDDGNALALVICKKLITLMQGKLEVESYEGYNHGNTIKFQVRVRLSLQPQRQNVMLDDKFRQKNILIVDDNASSKNVLKKQLEQWNIIASTASSAREALEIINRNPRFDIVITDLDMPQMNGVDLAAKIRERNTKASLILLNTAGDEYYKEFQGLFNAIVNKPIKQQVLQKNIFRELNKTNAVAEPQAKKQTLNLEFADQNPLRILIVEDNKTNQQVALKILSKLGYHADLANNGEEALEMVGDGKYDLIFMDIQMPGKDGLETTRMIRLCLSTQPVIIAMTANAIQGDRQKCLHAGMDDYISKPFRIEELIKMIEKWSSQVKEK